VGFDFLGGLRIVDLSQGLAGPYSTKLLADAGAEVIKVEPSAGDPMRRWVASRSKASGDGALFKFLNTSKSSMVADPAGAEVDELLGGAHLLVESGELSDRQLAEIRRRHVALSVLSVTPFGRSSPHRDRPSTEFTLQAECGSMSTRGMADREPVYAGGMLGEWIAGSYAAVAALIACRAAEAGAPCHLDLSVLECMSIAMHGYASFKASLGGTGFPVSKRQVELPSVEPAADGFVGITTNSRLQFDNFLAMIGRFDLLDDEGLKTKPGRDRRRDEFVAIVSAWTSKRSVQEILDEAATFRVPAAMVADPTTVANQDQMVARGVYVQSQDGTFVHPRPPYRMVGVAPRAIGRAPLLGENGAKVWERRSVAAGGDPSILPLHGVLILDLTAWWAGPSVGQMLGSLGADVIKIESVGHPDGQRLSSTAKLPPEDKWWETGYLFQIANVNKRGITLNLSSEKGRELLWQLIDRADAIVENFSPRVMEGFGFGWESIQQRNPRAVLMRMPAFGLDGPWRDRTGFAQTMEALSGMAWLTGYPDLPPILPLGPCDPLAGMHATFSLLGALRHRDQHSKGVFVETPMVESVLNAAAEMVIEYSAYGALLTRDGNRGPAAAPQGAYRCAGDDTWVAIAITTDAQWESLRDVMGRPGWAKDPAYSTDAGRRVAADYIDERITEWTTMMPADEVADRLVETGVPSAVVVPAVEVINNPSMRARGFVEPLDHPLLGRHDVLGIPFRMAGRSGGWIKRPAPMLGQHNDEILGGLLGLSSVDLAELRRSGVVGETI
jgi:crotonobetainyl-CoA:carnitine CoA-transferase CaiB-like acyl-CoA transferase